MSCIVKAGRGKRGKTTTTSHENNGYHCLHYQKFKIVIHEHETKYSKLKAFLE